MINIMIGSKDVYKGKIIKEFPKTEEINNFSCYNVGDGFDLLTLKGCPDKVNYFNCSHNYNLTSLVGCPQEMKSANCSSIHNLKDISALPSMINSIDLIRSSNVEIFTKEITSSTGTLVFFLSPNSKKIRKRIKEWKYYEVVNEGSNFIRVKQKSLGHKIIEDI